MTVLLDENDCIKIADFGMAKVVRRNVIQFALPDTRELLPCYICAPTKQFGWRAVFNTPRLT